MIALAVVMQLAYDHDHDSPLLSQVVRDIRNYIDDLPDAYYCYNY